MKEKVDFKNTLTSLGYSLQDRGDYWQTNAVFRRGDNKSAIQIWKDTGVWKDYVENSPFMPFNKLVQLTIGSTDSELVNSSIHTSSDSFYHSNNYVKNYITMEKIYSEDVLERLLPHFSFYESRGISTAVLKKFKCGLCTEGKMYQRLVFPIYNTHNQIHGFSGRDTSKHSKDRPKWKHLGVKTKWLYPHHLSEPHIKSSKEVILVESIGDVLNCYQNGIYNVLCVFGTMVSPSICSYLSGIDINKIIISFNNDAGKDLNAGLQGSVKSFYKLLSVFDFSSIIIHLPLKNDFGDMDSEDFFNWNKVKKEISFTYDYNDIINYSQKMINKGNQPKSFIDKFKKFKKILNHNDFFEHLISK